MLDCWIIFGICRIDLLWHQKISSKGMYLQWTDQLKIDRIFSNSIGSFFILKFFHFSRYSKIFIGKWLYAKECLSFQSSRIQYRTIHKYFYVWHENDHIFVGVFYSIVKPSLRLRYHTRLFHKYTTHYLLGASWSEQKHLLKERSRWCCLNEEHCWRKEVQTLSKHCSSQEWVNFYSGIMGFFVRWIILFVRGWLAKEPSISFFLFIFCHLYVLLFEPTSKRLILLSSSFWPQPPIFSLIFLIAASITPFSLLLIRSLDLS